MTFSLLVARLFFILLRTMTKHARLLIQYDEQTDQRSSNPMRRVRHAVIGMNLPSIITIDGPAGAGKSTLGELLAQRLGYLYFDTGVMYRALTLAALQQGIDVSDATRLAALARRLDTRVEPPDMDDGRQYTVLNDGRDVTWDLRRPEVEQHVSMASSHPSVRAIMRERQRDIGKRGHVVMVGRDIGNIVMPDAPLKIYLETSLTERVRRRADELRARGEQIQITQLEQEVRRRDALDQHVMAPAPDAIRIDGDRLSPEEEVEAILTHLRR
jgi:cytidylate kinase